MSEENFVFHCAPTLAGIKSGSLFTCSYSCRRQVEAELRALNRRLVSRGLRVVALRYMEKKVLVYVYRPRGLTEELSRGEARSILQGAGYTPADGDRSVVQLARKMARGGDFPHEIGLFLSYPPEDVKGFMENSGRDCKCVGTWKVYGDVDAARKRFREYKNCTCDYCRRLRLDKASLEQLAAAL